MIRHVAFEATDTGQEIRNTDAEPDIRIVERGNEEER
jgi:hypothetical protein